MSQLLPVAKRVNILNKLAPGNLFQPATVLWRIYEIEAVLEHVAFQGRTLDLGCGDGTLSSVIFHQDRPSVLMGLEPDPIDAASAERSGVYAAVHCAAGHSIPESDGVFDMVFSNSVLEHIPSIEPVLSDVVRVLRPGGRFVFTVPSEQFHACLLGRGFLPSIWRLRGHSVAASIDRRLQHHRYWSPEQWFHALAPLGFSGFSVHRYLPARVVQAWEKLSNWTGGLAFELFGRKSETRALQRRLLLERFDRWAPLKANRLALRLLLAKYLIEPMEVDGGPSGGLLVQAEKLSSV